MRVDLTVKPLDIMVGHMKDELEAKAKTWRSDTQTAEASRADLHRTVRRALAGGMTKAEVARATGLSRETIYTIINKEA